jgi:hypothetical protein
MQKAFIKQNSKLIKFELLKSLFFLRRKDDIFIKYLKEQIILRFDSSLKTINTIYTFNITSDFNRIYTVPASYQPYGYDTPLPVRPQDFTS